MTSSCDEAIFHALKHNDFQSLKFLIQNGLDPNYKLPQKDDFSLLHFAVGLCQANLVQFLLENGADPNYYSSDYLTPVHLSVCWDFDILLKLLLQFGGNPYICDLLGKSAFEIALEGSCCKCLAVLNEFQDKEVISQHYKTDSLVETTNWFKKIWTTIPSTSESLDLFNQSGASTLTTHEMQTVKNMDLLKNYSVMNNAFLTSGGSSVISSEDESTNDLYYSLLSEGSINGFPVVDYLYSDPEEKIALVERRFPGSFSGTASSGPSFYCPVPTSMRDGTQKEIEVHQKCDDNVRLSVDPSQHPICSKTRTNESLIHSDIDLSWFSAESEFDCGSQFSSNLKKLSNSEIREELLKLGKNPGPVTVDTRNVYLKWLLKLQDNPSVFKPEKNISRGSGLTNLEIREKLLQKGQNPGPVTCNTRGVYLKLLQKLNSQVEPQSVKVPAVAHDSLLSGYPQSLCLLATQAESDWFSNFLSMEEELRSDFDQPTGCWREGNYKSAFNYLLLDPRVTCNLPNRILSSSEKFEIFIKAVFYIGKGTRSRPLSHLYEAIRAKDKPEIVNSSKVKLICDIWTNGYGVVSMYCFQNIIPVEAYTREACMIFALGLKNITNVRNGECYGKASRWSLKKKCQFGSFLLYRALQAFLIEGERQIRPADLNIRNIKL